MKAHVIENGVVVNTIEVDSLDVIPNLVEATSGGIGWTYENGVFVHPPLPAEVTNGPTKEELAAQIAALSAQIQALG